MSELGLDSVRNGEGAGAVVDWQVRTAFASGCAGAFVFAWTDEWYRHGNDVRTGRSASRAPTARPSRHSTRRATRSTTCRFRPGSGGPASRSS